MYISLQDGENVLDINAGENIVSNQFGSPVHSTGCPKSLE
jgi:hypothetical protein